VEALTQTIDPNLTGVIASAAAGDETAFAWMVAAYHEDMRRVCVFITRDEGLAEDAVQAAWAIAWRKVGTVRDPERLRPWLVSVAANNAKDLVRKRGRRSGVEVLLDASSEAGGIDPQTGIGSIDLHAALDRLGPDDRTLLAMRYVAGFNATELAVATGISPSGTRTRLERLIARLRQELRDG
jgi:RNA polymerase sigma factor (sigma-70 family)